MQISTRSRHGRRAMQAIARSGSTPATGNDIAEGEDVSKKYLDSILGRLRRAGMLRTFRGHGGGYILARQPEEITAAEVVRGLHAFQKLETARRIRR